VLDVVPPSRFDSLAGSLLFGSEGMRRIDRRPVTRATAAGSQR